MTFQYKIKDVTTAYLCLHFHCMESTAAKDSIRLCCAMAHMNIVQVYGKPQGQGGFGYTYIFNIDYS